MRVVQQDVADIQRSIPDWLQYVVVHPSSNVASLVNAVGESAVAVDETVRRLKDTPELLQSMLTRDMEAEQERLHDAGRRHPLFDEVSAAISLRGGADCVPC